jgi:hypothetical protein
VNQRERLESGANCVVPALTGPPLKDSSKRLGTAGRASGLRHQTTAHTSEDPHVAPTLRRNQGAWERLAQGSKDYPQLPASKDINQGKEVPVYQGQNLDYLLQT